jgi:L-serine dehydratase
MLLVITGAEGGCQAECGSAALLWLSSAAIVEMMGGTVEQAS